MLESDRLSTENNFSVRATMSYIAPVYSLTEFFGDNSPLKTYLPGFRTREGQAWMAEAVADAIATSQRLVIEAGTGTGKTFAYLLPALLGGRKTIISTGTKALQDQLYHRDLPLVSKVMGRPVRTALLKGRANYLCLQRLESMATQATGSALADDLYAVSEWRHRTMTGDRAELVDVAEDSGIWPIVTSTVDNCLGGDCPFYQDCHVVKARRVAQEADLVVVNHHLLLADLAMKEEGFIEFLPGADVVILDEAHQVPDLAAQFFGVSLGSRELERIIEELRAITLSFTDAEFRRCLDMAQTAVRVFRAESPREEGRHELSAVAEQLQSPMSALSAVLKTLSEGVSQLKESSAEIEKLDEQLYSAIERLSLLASDETWDGLRWLDVNPRSVRLHLTPLDVADTLGGLINHGDKAWILTSGTLAIGEDFTHFTSRVGLTSETCLSFPSPYELDAKGLIWLPPGLPEPSDSSHTETIMVRVMPLLKETSGGMFCLFTSHRALNLARRWFRDNRKQLLGRPLLVQGDAPRDDLLRRFRQHGDAVLLGTGSFWEGVDVRGSALTIVVIDKLPFASPADPLMMARLEFIRRQGGNGFTGHQHPLAVLALKQGAGRLLRDESDFGVVVLCDPRIRSRNYGSVFLNSLAPMPHTESVDDVSAFLARQEAGKLMTGSAPA